MAPVRCAGESLSMQVWREETGRYEEVAKYDDVHGTFDEAIIFEADDAVRAELGIRNGIGGIFAERA